MRGQRLNRVGVAMSGGVDSSLSAFLLQKAGYQVFGFSLRLGYGSNRAWQDGATAAKHLGIPHQVVEARESFREGVLSPIAREYSRGRTPNPCALCNARVKFPILWSKARAAGCEKLATGHYARLGEAPWGPALQEGDDAGKSQTYFLSRLGPIWLERLIFPIGNLAKAQVREKARAAKLHAADRAESQDACFLPPGGWDELMESVDMVRPGVVEDGQGRVLAEHSGLHRFTVGQRRGLGVNLGEPAYVYALDGGRAAVKVGPRERLKTKGLIGQDPIWHHLPRPDVEVLIRFRYRCRPVRGTVRMKKKDVVAEFRREQEAVAPGQLAVFSQGPFLLGSAWIKQGLEI